ncbi:hypothetical protein Pla52n_54540 [Stieleria varia]|uniref:Uncharacterized protein n=2 Tax=Stieleria varia TaxID=2528005 RepID=A0A5C6A8L7_9BACT|nr:hypothetical protein Pla52n_54540 [Stieleria varia]
MLAIGCRERRFNADFYTSLQSIGYMEEGIEYKFGNLPPDSFVVVSRHESGISIVNTNECYDDDGLVVEVDGNGKCVITVHFAEFSDPDNFIAVVGDKQIVTARKPRHLLRDRI